MLTSQGDLLRCREPNHKTSVNIFFKILHKEHESGDLIQILAAYSYLVKFAWLCGSIDDSE